MRKLWKVAQIFNLLYRRFATCGPSVVLGWAADCKSAIRQIPNLRYCAALVLLSVLAPCGQLPAQSSATNTTAVRFMAVDIYVDSKDKPLAAYQLEFKATAGDVKIVGIEGGEHPAFAEAPHYDPKAIQHERVIIAAFSTNSMNKLPIGKTRVATIHLQVGETMSPKFELQLQAVADAGGNKILAEVSSLERKPQ